VRAFILLAAVAISTPAHAEGFAEFLAGLAIPVGDSDWTNVADPSPKLAARGGAMSGQFGGMIGVDWTPVNLDNGGGSFGIGSANGSAHRFRIIASAVFRHALTPRITLSARAGGGLDIAHASIDLTVLGSTTTRSDTDLGYAMEFGFELAMPIGHHDKDAQQIGDPAFHYTSVDIDLLFAVRL
jgi:hypothetical protein